jgi:pimeloyl-ACP methyl ester carboxylesterase
MAAPATRQHGDQQEQPIVGSVSSGGRELCHEVVGDGVPILLIHPSGATASTWGAATEGLARIGRVIVYDRRGYARSGGEPVRSMYTHTADAAALLEHLRMPPAVVVGTSAGAAIAVDLAVRRRDLVRVVVAHEFPWRFTHRIPPASQIAALAKIGALVLRGRPGDAAEVLLRTTYTYPDGTSAWDAFPPNGGRSPGRTREPLWRTSATRSSPIPPRRISRPSPSPSSAATAHAAGRAWSASSARLPPPSPPRQPGKSTGPAMQHPFDATTNFVRLITDSI